MIHYLGEIVTLATGEVGVIEFMDEEMDTFEIMLQDGNMKTCYSYEIL